MAWFYEIRDAQDAVFERGEGFRTQQAAIEAGNAEANRLKSTGNLPGSGFGTVTAGQDSQEPWK